MTDAPPPRRPAGRRYAKVFEKITLVSDLTTLPEAQTWVTKQPPEPEPHDVVLYLGCNVLQTSHMVETVTDILDMLGVDYVAVGGPGYCCGIVHNRGGDVDAGNGMARAAIKHIQQYQPNRVLLWCPSCTYYYDELFEEELPFETEHVAEFLAARLDQLMFVQEVPSRVALHWHSQKERRQREAEAAKTLLGAVPGLEYIEIGSDELLGNTCIPAELDKSEWSAMVEGQLRQAEQAGASTFATLYHSCQRYICVEEENTSLTIEHYLSVFARALGIDHEDTYKKYRLWGDPERALADMAPCMVANGVDAGRAREITASTFPPTTD
ncbi:MAG TPA: (Fe-S)-binding protein [Dehalococcoidia bacterium]|nr:(Fe-S)-binding protein [Dehalococcoidia bacterium]